MRDPMSWSIPVFRAFGIQVKVHLLFFIFTIGMFLRQVGMKGNPIHWVDVFLFTVVALFLIVLLHEFGHCFGARHVGGDAKEVLIWPLGGLAYVDVPHNPRAHFITTAAGPGVNVVICLVCAIGMAGAGYLPSLNPLKNPYLAEVYNFQEKRYDTSRYGTAAGYAESFKRAFPELKDSVTPEMMESAIRQSGFERHEAPIGVVWAYRVFFLSWCLFLFNLIPAYPLDGGRLLQAVVWSRRDYRKGVVVSAYTGFGVAVLFLIVSIAVNEALFMGLALFMLYESSMALYRLEMEDTGPFGYDFSAGYTSLEKNEEPPPKPRKAGWFRRWRQARVARRIQRENDERARDEERMDQLLDKIARTGKESLTEEERRFLERESARRRNMS
jgi:Zn-dependent protease